MKQKGRRAFRGLAYDRTTSRANMVSVVLTSVDEVLQHLDLSRGHVGVCLVEEVRSHVLVQHVDEGGYRVVQVPGVAGPAAVGRAQQVPQQRQHVQDDLLRLLLVHAVHQV